MSASRTPASTVRVSGRSLQDVADLEIAHRSLPAAVTTAVLLLLVALSTPLLRYEPTVFRVLFGGGIIVSLIRAIFCANYPAVHARGADRARRLFVIALVLQSSVWGGLGFVVVSHYGLEPSSVLVLVVMASVLAAGTSTLAIHRPSHNLFLAIVGLPYAIATFWGADAESLGLGAVTLLYLVFLYVEGKIVHERFWHALRNQDALEGANETKSRFLASVSHELRTPLTGVLGYTQLLRSEHHPPHMARTFEGIQTSAETLLRVINDLLDLSKVEAGKLEIVDEQVSIYDVVHAAVRTVQPSARRKSLPLRTEVDNSIPAIVRGDRGRLQQVIMNLVANAVRFTSEGHVVVRVRLAGTRGDEVLVRFEVEDTGLGIPDDRREAIFDAFTQADAAGIGSAGGSGLGLTICDRLVRLMGGTIDVESEPGEGSIFGVELAFGAGPAERDLPMIVMPREPPPVPRAVTEEDRRARVLLAEDDEACAESMRRLLEHLGYAVDVVHDGEAAREASCALPRAHQLILMDVNMPRLNGVDATSAIRTWERQHALRIPIIALTADAMPENRMRCKRAGVDAFATKPIRLEELEALIKPMLDMAVMPLT